MQRSDIRHQYLKLFPHLQKVIDQVDDKLSQLPSDDFQYELAFKPLDSVQNKLQDRHEDDLTQLSDLVRGRVFFSQDYTFEQAIDKIKDCLGDWIKHTENKKDKHDGFRYFGVVHLDLCIDGINFELQVMPVEHKTFLPILHYCYEYHRYNSESSNSEKDRLRFLNNDIYKMLEKLYHQLRQ